MTKWASIAAAIVALLASPSARAQLDAGGACKGANVTVTYVSRSVSARPDAQSPLWVSYADCNSADEFTFSVGIANPNIPSPAIEMQVWASEGSDCRAAGARSQTADAGVLTAASCVKVAYAPPSDVLNNKPITIPALTIASAVTGGGCADPNTSTLPHLVTLYFLLIRDTVSDQGQVDNKDATCWTQTKVDLLGPNPPASVTAGVGDGAIIVGFDISSQESDTFGYYYYCDDGTRALLAANPGDAGDAAATDAATDASSSSSSSGTADGGYPGAAACPTSKLVPGEIPPASLPTCGSAQGPGGATSALLPNNVEYTIGVSAYDTIGNAGRMSDLACATPQPIDDFYKLYRQDGGQAGGGYCSIGGAGAGVTLFGATALSVAAAFLARRRVRRRRSGRGRS